MTSGLSSASVQVKDSRVFFSINHSARLLIRRWESFRDFS